MIEPELSESRQSTNLTRNRTLKRRLAQRQLGERSAQANLGWNARIHHRLLQNTARKQSGNGVGFFHFFFSPSHSPTNDVKRPISVGNEETNDWP